MGSENDVATAGSTMSVVSSLVGLWFLHKWIPHFFIYFNHTLNMLSKVDLGTSGLFVVSFIYCSTLVNIYASNSVVILTISGPGTIYLLRATGD